MIINTDLIDAIVAKAGDKVAVKFCNPQLMSFEELYKLLSEEEIVYIKELLKEKPTTYGFNEPFRGLEEVPDDIVEISGQIVAINGKRVQLDTQYLPRHVYDAYKKLYHAYKSETGRELLVNSAYRSPANQAVNFMFWLQYYKYDFVKTLGFVSIPGYSEHSSATQTAIDFKTQEGIGVFDAPPFGKFNETPEYSWLQQNAQRFGFVLTCPEANKNGFNFEPWHWQYQG